MTFDELKTKIIELKKNTRFCLEEGLNEKSLGVSVVELHDEQKYDEGSLFWTTYYNIDNGLIVKLINMMNSWEDYSYEDSLTEVKIVGYKSIPITEDTYKTFTEQDIRNSV